MATGTKSMPSASDRLPNVKRSALVNTSRPTVASSRPMAAAMRALSMPPLQTVATSRMPSRASTVYSGGPKSSAKLGDQRGDEGQGDDREGSADEGADRGDAQGRACPALPGDRVSVEDGHHRGRLAGQAQEHGGDGAAVLRAVEDARQHDDRGRGLDAVGEREQDGDGRGRSQAGQDTDQHADEHADEAVQKIGRLKNDGEAGQEAREDIHASVFGGQKA